MTQPPLMYSIIAFDRDLETGGLRAVQREITNSDEIARQKAAELSQRHAGVIAGGRCPHPETEELGEGELIILARYGDVPEIE